MCAGYTSGYGGYAVMVCNGFRIFLCHFLLLLTYTVSAAEPGQTLPVVPQPFPAPEFSLKGEGGKQYRLSDFRGQVVLLNFWATWCPPCRREMPSMERAWKILKDKGVVILAINVGEDEDKVFEFTGQYPVSFPLPLDLDASVVRQYRVTGLPTTYIINPKGLITHRTMGSRDWDQADIIKQLLDMRQQKQGVE